MNNVKEPELIIADSWGIYIPQRFCEGFSSYITNMDEIKEDVEICLKGPDEEDYWEAWDNIVDNAKLTNDRGENLTIGYLPESSDLWAIPEDYEFPED